MFTRWGDLVYRLRYAVIGVIVAALLGLGGYGLSLGDHLSSSGWDDPGSESAQAARIADASFGRDHTSDVIVLYTAPEGKTINDPEFGRKIVDNLNSLPREYPDQIATINGAYWPTETGAVQPSLFGSPDKKHAFASIAIVGDNDTDMVRNFRTVKDAFYIDGVDVQVAGLQAVAGTLNDTMADDQKRMELLAIPAVGVLLFFVFGGIVAAALPLIVGGLTVIGAWGIIRFLTNFTEVNSFVSGVVSMIGLGLAIDYGLFIVSRFREELAEGYDTAAAVRRSVMTAGRTVVFSATMIIASLGGMLLFPQGFLKSVAYGTIATVSLAALASITVLPAMLGILGRRVDMLGLKRFRQTKSAEEVENSIWGRSTKWVMQHPLKIAIPICILLLLLIIPVKNLAFGGINERYLPPDNTTRLAQEHFDQIFPLRKSDPIQLVFISENTSSIGKVWREANKAPGLQGDFAVPSASTERRDVFRTSATLADSEDYEPTIDYLRSMDIPDDVQMLVGGQPAIQKDSIDALLDRMPLMIALVLFVTTLLMFLTFGSLVLPIKAALMSALGLGSTLGILTWIFVDGNGAKILNFTPQPIMSPVLVLIISIIYGLSTDYEVFLLSRMVEARTMGASTTESVRMGTAHTGRIITAAALILLVVTGAFAFSDLVMMQYIAYGMIAALFIDATILRMLLVPATMKLLGDDCWWAPAWMKRIQQKIGLGEPILDDERPQRGPVVDLVKTTPVTDPVTTLLPAMPAEEQRKTPHRKRTREEIEAEAPTAHMTALPKESPAAPQSSLRPAESAPAPGPTPAKTPGTPSGKPPAGPTGQRPPTVNPPKPMPLSPDPTRPRPNPPAEPSAGAAPAAPPRSTGPEQPERFPGPRGTRPPLRPRPADPNDQPPARIPAPRPAGARPPMPPRTPLSDERRPGVPGAGPLPTRTPGADDRAQTAGPLHQRVPGADREAPTPGAAPTPPRIPAPEHRSEPNTEAGPTPQRNPAPPRPMPRPVGGDIGATTPIPPSDPSAGPLRPAAETGSGRPGAGGPQRPQFPAPESATRPVDRPAPRPVRPEWASEPIFQEPEPSEPVAPRPPEPGPDENNRNSIEDWMAELRSSRRRLYPPVDDEGRHHSGDGRTVSVNELLRRREEE
ncbi:MMPL family transporter [Nocardia paucivorans]|uniref:MMPL family transporter n=1 Tax=Nocardia paucivorans TaxID=114259 RepID=UPI0002EDCCE3|nr:MMPL family transporter [Nocardia paucivorans]